jgi:hypothetical protein
MHEMASTIHVLHKTLKAMQQQMKEIQQNADYRLKQLEDKNSSLEMQLVG